MFVIRNVQGFDTLERVATLQDFASLPVSELEWFDVRGIGGDALLGGALAGDTLRITTNLSYWIQEQVPYTDQDFTLTQLANRVQGASARCFTSGAIQLPGYVFSDQDVGRWVRLSDFPTTGNNGWAQITSFVGGTAQTNRTFSANETNGSWAFPWLRIQSIFGGVEPRYFPTREQNLGWELRRSGSYLTAGTGGATARGVDAPLVRSVRNTTLAPTLDAATDLFEVVRKDLMRLQQAATTNDTAFTVLITTTVGP